MRFIVSEKQFLFLIESNIKDVVPEPEYQMPDLSRVSYDQLNAKQKESYNFQKVSAILADYGYFPIRLSDDWESADFICIKCTTKKFLKVQLKGSFSMDKKYLGKDLFIAFQDKSKGDWYLYPHDYIVQKYIDEKGLESKPSWSEKGFWFNNPPTKYDRQILQPFKL